MEGIPRYLFCVFKLSAADTAQNNFQRCSNANLQNLQVEWAGNVFPSLLQDADFSRNKFIKTKWQKNRNQTASS